MRILSIVMSNSSKTTSAKYSGTVTPKGAKFLHVINSARGGEIDRRLSKTSYRQAAIGQRLLSDAKRNLEEMIAHAEEQAVKNDAREQEAIRHGLTSRAVEAQTAAHHNRRNAAAWRKSLEALPATQAEMPEVVIGYGNTGKWDTLRGTRIVTFEVDFISAR